MDRDRVIITEDGRERVIVGTNVNPGESEKFYRPTETPNPVQPDEDVFLAYYKQLEDKLADKMVDFVEWIEKKVKKNG